MSFAHPARFARGLIRCLAIHFVPRQNRVFPDPLRVSGFHTFPDRLRSLGEVRAVPLGNKCAPTSSVQAHLFCQRTCLARALAAQTRWRSLLPGYIPRFARRSRWQALLASLAVLTHGVCSLRSAHSAYSGHDGIRSSSKPRQPQPQTEAARCGSLSQPAQELRLSPFPTLSGRSLEISLSTFYRFQPFLGAL